MVRKQLDAFERLVRSVVEGSFHREAQPVLSREAVLRRVQALARSVPDADLTQRTIVVSLNSEQLGRMETLEYPLAEWLDAELQRSTSQALSARRTSPLVRTPVDEGMPVGEVRVEWSTESESEEQTRAMRLRPIATSAEIDDLEAFLIVNGKEHFLLQQPIITVGRHADADLVLISPRVSRRHAQLRYRFGRYVIYDLAGRAGTVVNGKRIREVVLSSGDVIQLADVTLIYGENRGLALPASDEVDTGNTQVMNRPTSDSR